MNTMEQQSRFIYVKLKGVKKGTKLSPEEFEGREPNIKEVYDRLNNKNLIIETQTLVAVKTDYQKETSSHSSNEAHWLTEETWNMAKSILRAGSSYDGHIGVTFTASNGAWLIRGTPEPIEPPIGAPKNESFVRVETELSARLGLAPFIVEKRFVFKGFKGEDVEIGRVKEYRYFLAAYNRKGTSLTKNELEETFLWKNYLSIDKIKNTIESTSAFMKKAFWEQERMNNDALAQYKVVWRDAAKEFIPAIEDTGAVPDYTVNYIVVNNINEGYYLLALLLAPQINAVVKELTPWIGHVQPRFINYFYIRKFNPNNPTHVKLSQLGKEIRERGDITEEQKNRIKDLVDKLANE